MGLKFTNYFDDSMYESPDVKIIACLGCSSHLCLSDLVICDGFTGASGPALLVDKLINIEADSPLQRTSMKTGHYQIYKVRCHQCKAPLGWYYKKAYSSSQSYKEGKFVVEEAYVKFVSNHPSTNDLLQQAMRNKIRRRYS
ncbi:yippee-domain-containing protein, partial [Suhomyces tanzawaensis NRRL Y-17324]